MDVLMMPQALHQNKIDAFAAWEPIVEYTLHHHQAYANYRAVSTGYLYFGKPVATTKPKACQLILAASIRAQRWLKSGDENLKRAALWTLQKSTWLLKRPLGLTAQQMVELAKRDILGEHAVLHPWLPARLLEKGGDLHREFLFLKKIGKINNSYPWENMLKRFNDKPLRDILANPGQWQLDRFDYSLDDG